MSSGLGGVPQGFDRGNITIEAMKAVQADETIEKASEQISSQKEFKADQADAVNPFAAAQKKEKIAKPTKSRIQKMMESKEKLGNIPIKEIEDKAGDLAGRNPEFANDKQKLVDLRKEIKPSDKKQDILNKVKTAYPDKTLADDVLLFLLETTDGELHIQVQEAIKEFRGQNEVELKAGQNITEDVRDFAKQGVLSTPSEGRDDYYKYITAPQVDTFTKFEEMSKKYSFEDMDVRIKFLLSALGSDHKSKGPSIPPAELGRLMSETKTLQAIHQMSLIFKNDIALIDKMCKGAEIEKPTTINYQTMAELFMRIAKESHPTSDKVRQHVESTLRESVGKSGKLDNVTTSVILGARLLAAVEQVSPTYILRSPEHKRELKASLIEFGDEQDDLIDDLNDKLN